MSKKKSLKEKIKISIKYSYIILFVTMLFGISSFYFSTNLPSYFESKSIILMSSNEKENVHIRTFIEHLQTRDLINKVINDLQFEESYEDFIALLNIKNIKSTNLIEIKSKYNNPKGAQSIIESLINIFNDDIEEFYPEYQVKIIETPNLSTKLNIIDSNALSLVGSIIGFIISYLLVISFGSIDVNIKNHEDVKKHLNLNSLGIIPNNDIDLENNVKRKKNDSNISIIDKPNSMISESYRMIRTNLDFLDLKVINFTSTSPSEGKSEVITNIALAFAMIGKKVILIDCDLRKPVVHKNLKLNRTLGLSDIILYDRVNDYKEYIQEYKLPDKESTLNIISAGSKIYNPSEMLNSVKFKNLISNLKNDYDLILIDCPPISLMTDAVVVSKVADGTAYVIEYDRINSSAINGSIEQLKNVDTSVIGTIITKVNIRKQKKLYGNKYEYYYSNYM